MLGQILTFRICAFAVTLPGFARNEANVTLILGHRDHPGSDLAKTDRLTRQWPKRGLYR
jgi:hypothetical protein